MVDSDIVAVDVRVFLAVGRKVSARSREVRKREGVDVIERELRERSTSPTIAKIVSRNRRSIRGEDRSERRRYGATASKRKIADDVWPL
jgi:hypothetical protein